MAAGIATAPWVIPASALGRNGSVAPSERIVMGGIGLGGRGSYDLGALLNHKDVQVVAVCDLVKGRREAAKKSVDAAYASQDCAVYHDMRQLLSERADVEAVLIATGDRWHALASVWAMQAGKDVYCEKPACLTMAQGEAIVETARRYGRVFQTGAQRLSEPHHVFAIEMARSGQLGTIHTVYADTRWRDGLRHDWLPAEPEPPREELDWDAFIGPCPWRPYNRGYLDAGWYRFYDFATDVAMWGAHTVAQALAGLDMSTVSSIEFEYAGLDATMETRLSNGVKMVLFRVSGSVWDPCRTGMAPVVSDSTVPKVGPPQPTVIPGPMFPRPGCCANTRKCSTNTPPVPNGPGPRAGLPGLHPVAPFPGGECRGHVPLDEHLPGCRHLRTVKAELEVRPP
jgi:hypothetical protein